MSIKKYPKNSSHFSHLKFSIVPDNYVFNFCFLAMGHGLLNHVETLGPRRTSGYAKPKLVLVSKYDYLHKYF